MPLHASTKMGMEHHLATLPRSMRLQYTLSTHTLSEAGRRRASSTAAGPKATSRPGGQRVGGVTLQRLRSPAPRRAPAPPAARGAALCSCCCWCWQARVPPRLHSRPCPQAPAASARQAAISAMSQAVALGRRKTPQPSAPMPSACQACECGARAYSWASHNACAAHVQHLPCGWPQRT